MAKSKVYAVARGHQPGLYASWPEVQCQIDGFTGNRHKRFDGPTAREDALRWLIAEKADLPEPLAIEAAHMIVAPVLPEAATPVPAPAEPIYYAVAQGRRVGLFSVWDGSDGAKAQIEGLASAVCRKFVDRSCALIYLHDRGAQLAPELAAEVAAAVAALPPPPSGRDEHGRVRVRLTSDGCALGQGQGGDLCGGWGVVLEAGAHRKELSGGLIHTNSQRAELLALYHGLEALKSPAAVELETDSMTLVNGINRELHQRPALGVANGDLWLRISQVAEQHTITASYRSDEHRTVRRCHELANAAARGSNLIPDQRLVVSPAVAADDDPLFPENE